MSPNKQNYSSYQFKIIILIFIGTILVILGIIFTINNNQPISTSTNNGANNVEVVNSQNLLPQTQAKPEETNTNSSPQGGPATVEDLGGSKSGTQSIDELLKDKEIEIK
jgi:hypothetical protein